MKCKNKPKSGNARSLAQAAKVKLPKVYPWKVLNALHKDLHRFLTDRENEELDRITRNRDFESYLHLSEAWGLLCINPQDICLEEIRAKYQLTSLLKKFQFQTSVEQRINAVRSSTISVDGRVLLLMNWMKQCGTNHATSLLWF